MKIQAHRIDKIAEKASFITTELFEYLLDDIDAIYCNDDGVEYFAWLEKEDLDELEELLEEYRTGEYEDEEEENDDENEDEEEEFDEDEIELPVEEREYDFTEKDFRQAELIIKKIKQDLDKDGSVIYLFQ